MVYALACCQWYQRIGENAFLRENISQAATVVGIAISAWLDGVAGFRVFRAGLSFCMPWDLVGS